MRYSPAIVAGVLLLGTTARAESGTEPSFDWRAWSYLPVLDGGRYKPLDSLARETLRLLSNRAGFIDPDTGEKLSPTAFYLTTLFERQPADPPGAGHGSKHPAMPFQEKPDRWDNALLFRVDDLRLRRALGMADGEKYTSPAALGRAAFRDPRTDKETPFLLWADKVGRNADRSLPVLQRKGLELAERLGAYREHRAGKGLALLPIPDSDHEAWYSLADLAKARLSNSSDPTGELREAQRQLRQVRAALVAGDAEAFNEASAAFLATVGELGPQWGAYPNEATIRLEVAYNRWVPFRFAWVFTTLALVSMLLSAGTRWRVFYAAGMISFLLGFVAMGVGFGMRSAISGRAPVTNMYESVVYLALGTAVFGLVFELMYRRRFILAAASAIATVALVLADNCPAVLDPTLRPLQPVLRSNFWLVIHVMSITLSYAAFALALGIGNITLGCCAARSRDPELIAALTRFTYKALQVGVLLLAVGTVLGGVWAAYSWGRFWGWDPKEVWALITLLGYLAVLHARYVGWVSERGLAALSVICFALVIMAWYGVNFVLGAGLHTYGFGGGGQEYVFGAVGIQFLYVAAALLLSPGGWRVRTPEGARQASMARLGARE